MANTYQQLIDEWNKAQAESKAANLARYEEVKGGYSDLINRTRSRVQTLGGQEKTDIVNRGLANQASAQQDMISRGLTGTTIAPTVRQGYQRDTQAALARLQDQLTRQELATVNPLEQERLRFIERREDEGPDSSLYANLLNRAGRAGGSTTTSTSRMLFGGNNSGVNQSGNVTKVGKKTEDMEDPWAGRDAAYAEFEKRQKDRRQTYLDSLKKKPASTSKTVMRNFTMEQVAPGNANARISPYSIPEKLKVSEPFSFSRPNFQEAVKLWV